jgi:hypothetical protein
MPGYREEELGIQAEPLSRRRQLKSISAQFCFKKRERARERDTFGQNLAMFLASPAS